MIFLAETYNNTLYSHLGQPAVYYLKERCNYVDHDFDEVDLDSVLIELRKLLHHELCLAH